MPVMEPLAWIVLRLGAVGPTGNPAQPGSCRGRYHTDRQPFTLQYTARCPAAPPPDAACAAGQSHSTHDTMINPGPHSCPFAHRSG
jgi:hypothetical protein